MGDMQELIVAPLSGEELGARYQALCDDPRFENLPGKIELDSWGRILMSPATPYHGVLQGRLGRRLAALGGETIMEAPVVTAVGLLVVDLAWASTDFVRTRNLHSPLTQAPELCIEIVSPSNSVKELREKIDAYLAAGAVEAWLAYPQTKRFEFFTKDGKAPQSNYAVDLSGLFD
jgi:Uma2 family endonuclease